MQTTEKTSQFLAINIHTTRKFFVRRFQKEINNTTRWMRNTRFTIGWIQNTATCVNWYEGMLERVWTLTCLHGRSEGRLICHHQAAHGTHNGIVLRALKLFQKRGSYHPLANVTKGDKMKTNRAHFASSSACNENPLRIWIIFSFLSLSVAVTRLEGMHTSQSNGRAKKYAPLAAN